MYALYILVFGPVKECSTCMSKKKTYFLCIYILNVSNFYILCFLRYLIVYLKVSDVAEKKYLVLQITEYAVYCLMYAMISSTNRCLHCLHIKTNKSSFFVVYITVYRNIFVFVKLKVFCGLFLEIKASNNVALQFFYLTFSREKKSERVTFLQLS